MAGAAANLKDTLIEILANEGNQRRLDTGVIVLLVIEGLNVGVLVAVRGFCQRLHPAV